MKPLIAIDGDIVRYRCGFAAQHTFYNIWMKDDCEPDGEAGEWSTKSSATAPVMTFNDAKTANKWLKEQTEYKPEDIVRIPRIKVEPLKNALYSLRLVMENIQAKYPDGELRFYGSCPTPENWRYEIYPEYKANRPDRQPFWAPQIKEYVERKYGIIAEAPYEADDLIAMAAHECREVGRDCVIVTIDKDMDQIPGVHYNWVTDEEYSVSDVDALRNLLRQSITGDSTDNIKGIPGWGAKAANEWLKGCSTDSPVLDAYRESGEWKDPTEAEYHALLNTALVTLPTTQDQMEFLKLGVQYAAKAVDAKPSQEHEAVGEETGPETRGAGG